MKRRILSYLVALTLLVATVATVAGCTGSDAPGDTGGGDTPSSAPSQESAPEPAADPAEPFQQAGDSGYQLDTGDWVIGLSNSYFGNTWRKQMVDNFISTAELAKSQGLIKDYEVMNGDNSVNAQVAQINSFILKGVDAICINAASPTALNSVIQKAVDAGIVVVAFDSIVDNQSAYTIDFDFVAYGEGCVESVVRIAGEDARVIVVRGVSGSAPDIAMYEGNMNALARFPNVEVLATVNGEASATKSQEEITKILPSLSQVDGVITQGGGDAYGVAQAFEQYDGDMPVIIGDNSAEFIQWWLERMERDGYETASQGSTPSISSAAFWTALYILNDCEVPMTMSCQYFNVDNSNVQEFSGLTPGTIVSPNFSPDYVVENVIKPYL